MTMTLSDAGWLLVGSALSFAWLLLGMVFGAVLIKLDDRGPRGREDAPVETDAKIVDLRGRWKA